MSEVVAETPRLVLACGGLRRAMEALEVPVGVEVEFLDPELHRSPRRSREAIQRRLDALDAATRQVALAWGLCGGAVVGLTCPSAWLVLPRVHDCIALHLPRPSGDSCSPEVQNRPLETPGTGFCTPGVQNGRMAWLTPGWLATRRDPLGIFEDDWLPRVGRDEAERTLRRQFAGYERLVVVDAGLDDALRARARRNADLLGLPLDEVPGSVDLLRRLVDGDWDADDFVLVPPGQPVPRAPFLNGPAPPAAGR